MVSAHGSCRLVEEEDRNAGGEKGDCLGGVLSQRRKQNAAGRPRTERSLSIEKTCVGRAD